MKYKLWTTEIPTQCGLYFFYGDIYWGEMNQNPDKFLSKIEIVEVTQAGNGLVYICNGGFLNIKNNYGLWYKNNIKIPVLPKINKPNYNG